MVVLSGEAGIGKTRLAKEFMLWVSNQGMVALSTRSYTAMEHIAFAPLATLFRSTAVQASISRQEAVWLAEFARLVLDLLVEHPKLPRPDGM